MEDTEKVNCFAYVNDHRCNALIEKNCKNCTFYKERTEIKNNVYYPYSYDSFEEYMADMENKDLIFID